MLKYRKELLLSTILSSQRVQKEGNRVMFQQGQQVIYGGNGVCRIEEIIERDNGLPGGVQQVYVIRLASGLTAYVPVKSNVFMRALITPEEAERVLADYPSIGMRSFAGTNSKALSDQYRAVIARHDPREMLCLYKSLRNKVEQARRAGKKPGAMDERFASAALEQVVQELSIVLCRSAQEICAQLPETVMAEA